MLLGVLGWVFVGIIFCISAATRKCCLPRNPSVVSEQPCVHQNRFVVESFLFLVPMFSKFSKMRFFGMKRFRSSVVLKVYGHEMI